MAGDHGNGSDSHSHDDAGFGPNETENPTGSLADRFREIMGGSGNPVEEMRETAMMGGEGQLFSLVQQEPFAVAEVTDPIGSGTIDVLYPALAPRPPNTENTRGVGPAEAMSIIATTPLEIVRFESDSFPDMALVPSAVGEDIVPDEGR